MCKGQAQGLRDSLDRFSEMDAQPIVIVPHERCRTKWWAEQSSEKVLTLADPAFLASSLYGVAYQMRIHVDVSNTPGTFVIDKKGVLRWAHIGTGPKNWADRPKPEKVLEELEKLKK